MSVVINSNFAATVAANNLSASTATLQKSLNRLSSGSKIVVPSDDAGGLAASIKLSAAAKRQGAISSNLANTVSFLQAQDGVLAGTAKVLDRMGELKTLHGDVTKSTSDQANYQTEFTALQSQLTANALETFNGVSLFGTSVTTVPTTEDGLKSVDLPAATLNSMEQVPVEVPIESATTHDFTAHDFTNTTGWSDVNGVADKPLNGAGTGTVILDAADAGHASAIVTSQSFPVPCNITAVIKLGAGATLNFSSGGSTGLGSGGSQHIGALGGAGQDSLLADTVCDLKIAIGTDGSSAWSIDGDVLFSDPSGSNFFEAGKLSISATGAPVQLENLEVTQTHLVTQYTGDIADVAANGATLGNLPQSSITEAISDIASTRARNGASQSRLGFASELNTVNQANLVAANSRITDVDVAQESTSLARYNVLVQAGTAMLTQANQSNQLALKLLA